MQKSVLAALRSHVLLRTLEAEDFRFLSRFAQLRPITGIPTSQYPRLHRADVIDAPTSPLPGEG